MAWNGLLTAGWARTGDPLPALRQPCRRAGLQGARLAVSAPIHQGRTQLGSVYMRSLAEPWSRRLTGYSGIALLVLMAALLVAGLGASNASLVAAHAGQLSREMAERERIEAELHETQRAEALSQLEAATRRGDVELAMSEAQMEFALRAGEMGSWTRDLSTGAFPRPRICSANTMALRSGEAAGRPVRPSSIASTPRTVRRRSG